jgi:hypothetical protein
MRTTAPQPLLSPAVHVAGIAGALAILFAATSFAGHASQEAVHSAQAALSPTIRYISLHPVEVVVRRNGRPLAEACAQPQART